MDATTPKHILIVDSDPGYLQYLKPMFKRSASQYRTTEVHTVDACWRELAQRTFDLIVIDFHVGGENGVELCRKIKASKIHLHTKTILCAGSLNDNLMQYAKSAGADCVLSKFQNQETWRRVVRTLLGEFRTIPKTRILIVDDDDAMLHLLKLRFEAFRYEVSTASDGEEAQRKAVQELPDVILMDVMMPGDTGMEVCVKLKKDPRTRKIPVVLISAFSGDIGNRYTQQAGRDAWKSVIEDVGAEAFVRKPFDPAELRQTIEAACRDTTLQRKILIIDDNEQDQKLMKRYLKRTGYQEILIADSGDDGMRKIGSERPNVVILGATLSGMDGYEVCKRIKKTVKNPPKIIMTTGITQPVNVGKARAVGADDCVIKTPDYGPVIDAVRKLL